MDTSAPELDVAFYLRVVRHSAADYLVGDAISEHWRRVLQHGGARSGRNEAEMVGLQRAG
jgi:formate dehydrogenase assembly factor FdhD